MAYDRNLAQMLRAALSETYGVAERPMFGGLTFMLNGHMLCGVSQGRFMFRVGKAREADALRRPGASPVSFNRRRMGGLVWVRAEACPAEAVGEWLDLARAFVASLPAKREEPKK